MKSSFHNKNTSKNKNKKSSSSTPIQSSEGEDTEADESLFYSAMDTLKSSIRSSITNDRNAIINQTCDQSDYEESPKASAIYLESTAMESSDLPITISSSNKTRKYKDLKWSALFILSSLIWLFSGFVILLATNQSIDAQIYNRIIKSIGTLTLLVTITIFIFIVWTYSLFAFTKKSILGTITTIPILLFITFLSTLLKAFQFNPVDKKFVVIATILLTADILFTKLVKQYARHLTETALVIEYAFNIINSNTSITVLSFVLFSIFVLFNIIWLIFYTRIWLLGVGHDGQFILKDHVYFIAGFYLFYYIWSCTIIINIQRFAVSFITSQRYFHQHEPNNLNWKAILMRGVTTSFGTIILCSLILRPVHFINRIAYHFKNHFRRNSITFPIYLIIDWFDRLSINHYIVSFIGMTEEGFYSAIESSNSLFRRNLLTGLFSDSTTEFVLLVSPFLTSICTALLGYLFITQDLGSTYDIQSCFLIAIILLFTAQFFSYLIMSAVESGFICYAMDIDTNNIRSPETHTIYSNFD